MAIVRGMTYDEYVEKVCAKMNINHKGATFAYTLLFDPLALQPLKSDEDFTYIISFSDRFVRVYISTSLALDVVEDISLSSKVRKEKC